MSHEHEHACGCADSCEHEQTHAHDTCGCGCQHDEEHEGGWLKLAICAVIFIVGVLVPELLHLPPLVQALWMALAAVPLLLPLMKEAREELRDQSMGENVLLVIAVIAAFVIGEWIEGTMVLLLFILGENIEHKAMDHSRRAISSLAAMTPDTALRIDASGDTTEIPATQVAVGDTLRIPPHSRVPVDCTVLSGESEADVSALTGESMPVYCAAGTQLMSGSVNGAGTLTVTATKVNADSAAARILRLVEDSAAQKGSSEKFITRFARVYTPAVTVAAVLVAVLPPLFGGVWSVWIYRALAFLVASCPCALVISIPLGFYAGIAAAARRGILIKGGSFVETLAKVKAVAFDKTGTLTADTLHLDRVITSDKVCREEVLHIAAALETHSAHPAARAICAAASAQLRSAEALQELPGLGVTATVDGRRYACGGARLMERFGADVSAFPAAPVYLCRDDAVIAAFTMSAALQEGAVAAVKVLRDAGVRRLVMLTGDRQAEADAVAAAVGIGEARGDLLPEDKLTGVRALQAAGYVTAFVGDGINDAPVLAAADVGVAMGLGSAAAIETADMVLVPGGLSRLPEAVKLCRRVVRTVWSNILFALGVKAAVLILAVFGIAPMWLAVFADMGVTILCIFNALRILLTVKK